MTAQQEDDGALDEQYRDLTELDRRGWGTRHSASLRDGGRVVVFVLSRELAARIQHPEGFLTALRRAASVTHPAITPLVAWGRTDGGAFHCAYESSGSGPFAPGSLSPTRVAAFGLQISGALSTIHSAGLFHGGIQTGAIVHSEQLGAQLTAFGLFAALSDGGVAPRVASLAACGAPYMSPERQAGALPDAPSDIFSLGASLYELLTGKPPFGGRTTSSVMATVLSESSSQATEDSSGSTTVVEALLRAIEQAPEDRWPTADAFARALKAGAADRAARAGQGVARSGWMRLFAIFQNAWFPTRRSRE